MNAVLIAIFTHAIPKSDAEARRQGGGFNEIVLIGEPLDSVETLKRSSGIGGRRMRGRHCNVLQKKRALKEAKTPSRVYFIRDYWVDIAEGWVEFAHRSEPQWPKQRRR